MQNAGYDAIVLLGFGGPAEPGEIRPFLDRVLEGRPIPRERYELVVSHYEHIGGASPYNELTQRQANALEALLAERGYAVPVLVAYLNAPKFVNDVAAQLARDGARHVLGIALAPHQSPVSSDKYERAFEVALRALGSGAPSVDFTPHFYARPLFIRAHAERLHDALRRLGRSNFASVPVIFTAHSIPTPVAQASPYVTQFTATAELAAQEAGVAHWSVAYQSRSGSPRDPWLEPDIRDALRAAASRGVRETIVAPIGFLCDHVEVLYDLDVDAQQTAAECGIRMERATALNDHPLFIEVLADLVTDATCAAARLR
jgi:ferrochelatase